jgi:hypothetical protein
MRRRTIGLGIMAVALLMAVPGVTFRILGQDADSSDPMVGTWKLNLAKSVNMPGPDGTSTHPTRAATRVVSVEGDGFRMTNYDDATPNVTRSYFFKPDGKDYPDPRGPGRGEVGYHWRPNPFVMLRLVTTKGKPTEWVNYAVSADGNELITTMWAPETPDKHQIQVYDRAK